jgi:hypothetical protein
MRLLLTRLLPPVVVVLGLGAPSWACNLFKVTMGGVTMVGNNEDAWSINARIRFERGKSGEYGAVYVGHFNGSPLRRMVDQGGMNEAGLMFDGLVVEPKNMPMRPGLRQIRFDRLMPLVMRTCATVHEAMAFIRTVDMSWLTDAMLVLVDRNGDYLVVEGDTLFTGNDATYAFGNFRPSMCTNFGSVPIPRYQKGRALLVAGADTSLAFCTAVMDSMRACRAKFGNGTLYTNIFDLEKGIVHLYFYHDFTERRTFSLKEELAKGDRELEMPALFRPNVEYEQLVAYATPFHRRGLFYVLLAAALLALVGGTRAGFLWLGGIVARIRNRTPRRAAVPLIVQLVSCAGLVVLVPILLLNEGVFYFGLGDVAPVLAWVPIILSVAVVGFLTTTWRTRATSPWTFTFSAALFLPFIGLLGYWRMLWP